MAVVVSHYTETDADDIAALFNRYPDNPNPLQGRLSGEMVQQEMEIRRTAGMFVARDGDELVATLGLFRDTGRRTARPHELLGDMFYVAPSYRQGLVTGQIFHDAMMWLMDQEYFVLGLTVNPANTTAFQLYRRAGCVSITSHRAGDDGNVELHNFTPLILHSIMSILDADIREAVRTVDNIATLSRTRSHDDPDTDVVVIDGARCVEYEIGLNSVLISAAVDIDTWRVLPVTVTTPTGDVTVLQPVQVGLREPERAGRRTVLRHGELTCEIDVDTGTVELFADGHHGPLARTTWPSLDTGTRAGWRHSRPVRLEVTELGPDVVGPGLQIVQRVGAAQHRAEIRLGESFLLQHFQFTDAGAGLYQEIGVRRGSLVAARPGSTWRIPLGVGIGLRDSSEMFAAARPVESGDTLVWEGADRWSVSTGSTGGDALVHSRLLDRTLPPGSSTLRTTVHTRPAAAQTPTATPATGTAAVAAPDPATAGRPVVPGRGLVRLEAAAGGVTAWKLGDGHRVLRSAWPRTRSFGSNPQWSAGMWITCERPRFDREHGIGWGATDGRSWSSEDPHTLTDTDGELQWSAQECADGLQVDIDARGPDEVVLWSTPMTPPAAEVFVDGGRRLIADAPWLCWTTAVSVSLGRGRQLHVRSVGTRGHPEIAVRSGSAGLLLGCVQAPTDGTVRGHWTFQIISPDAPEPPEP